MEERPLECSQCTRKATVVYKKVKCGRIESCRMCQVCPCLQSKIGIPVDDEKGNSINLNLSKKCPNCHSNLYDVTIERKVGCSTCYLIFEDFILGEVEGTNPIHLGGCPKSFKSEDVLKKLESLQFALSEAVTAESYERAALLRDQIKTLNEKIDEKKR